MSEPAERPTLRYRVWIRSRGGFYAQYDGYVDVWAEDDAQAEDRAYRELKRTSFPDRSRDMWRTERIECRGRA